MLPDYAQLFDFQVNGFGGVDFQRSDLNAGDIAVAVEALERHRTTAILFTLVTDDVDALCHKLERIEKMRRSDERIARVIRGYHLEGPWITTEPGYHGAHPVDKVEPPSLSAYTRLRDAGGGRVKLITLAPEVEGAVPVIESAVADGIRISLGHTNASDEAIDNAIKAGATLATHVGNAVPLEMHRHDNVIQRLLARDELIACFIPDGLHLPPFVLKNYFRAKPTGRAFFTTDCMAAAGAGPGRYTVGPHAVDVGDDGIVRLPSERVIPANAGISTRERWRSRFAGSSLTLDRGVANIVEWLALDSDEAIELCSTRPAKHFGIEL